jgi:dienelactone hydrolase
MFGRSRFTGPLPAPGGSHAVVVGALSLPGGISPTRVQVWQPQAAEDSGASRAIPGAGPRYPLVLFAPGWGGFATDAGLLVADLASRGYVIVGFDDIAHDPAEPGETPAQQRERSARFDVSSDSAFERSARAAEARTRAEALKARRVLDAIGTLKHEGHSWLNHADTTRVGFLGFSFGGCVAAETAFDDARIAAVANVDGRLFGKALERGVPRPYLLFSSIQSLPIPGDVHSTEPPRRIHAQWAKVNLDAHAKSIGQHGMHWFLLEDSLHEDFTDAFFRPSWRAALRRGWSFRLSQRAAVNSVIAAFFDTYVGERPSPLMRGAPAPGGTRRIDSPESASSAPLK